MASGKRSWRNERKMPSQKKEYTSSKERQPNEAYTVFLQRMCDEGKLLHPKGFVLDLGLLPVPHADVCDGLESQYRLSRYKKDKWWIEECRLEAQALCDNAWIDQYLPSLSGKSFTKKRKVQTSIWDPDNSGMCRDIRLDKDPSIQVGREDAGTGQTSAEGVMLGEGQAVDAVRTQSVTLHASAALQPESTEHDITNKETTKKDTTEKKNTIRDNTEQENKRQKNTEQDNMRRDSTKPDNTRRDNTKLDNTRRDNTQSDNTRRDNTKQDNARRGNIRRDANRWGNTKRDTHRRDHTREDHNRYDHSRRDHSTSKQDHSNLNTNRWKNTERNTNKRDTGDHNVHRWENTECSRRDHIERNTNRWDHTKGDNTEPKKRTMRTGNLVVWASAVRKPFAAGSDGSVVAPTTSQPMETPKIQSQVFYSTAWKNQQNQPKRSVTMEDEPTSKRPKLIVEVPAEQPAKPCCPFPDCPSTDKKTRRHVFVKHLPFLFGEKTPSLFVHQKRLDSLTSLVQASLGENATLDDAMTFINSTSAIPKDSEVNDEHTADMRGLCQAFGWNEPETFSLHPVSHHATLIHWRCLVALLLRLSALQQYNWCRSGRLPPASPQITPPSDDELEEFMVMDEVGDDSSSDENQNNNTSPQAFDSHFHLDRTSHKLFGQHHGHTVEDLLETNQSTKPVIDATLVGGVTVYSEPKFYPKELPLKGKWKLALGVHPKHVDELTTERFLTLQQLVNSPQVDALGEIGLDRSVPAKFWRRQDETFRKVLQLSRPELPVVLHLRGPDGDKIGADVHARALQIMRKACKEEQKLHIHCFMGDCELVREWMAAFPNVHFGFTAAVQKFDREQIQALQLIPIERILLETDSPYMPPAERVTNTPAFIGDVAGLVAAHLDMPVRKLLHRTVGNSFELYGR